MSFVKFVPKCKVPIFLVAGCICSPSANHLTIIFYTRETLKENNRKLQVTQVVYIVGFTLGIFDRIFDGTESKFKISVQPHMHYILLTSEQEMEQEMSKMVSPI